MQLNHFSLDQHGFGLVSSGLSAEQLDAFRVVLDEVAAEQGSACVRNLLSKCPEVVEWTACIQVRSLIGEGMIPVRAILFDKREGENWPVAWHQDLTIAVTEKREVDGYGPWSVKHGVPHVQPPAAILEQMVTLRLHLDDTPAENGALLVSPSTHLNGRLPQHSISSDSVDPVIACECQAGDIVMMRPLLLHASKRSEKLTRRRVVHVDFAPADCLTGGLQWFELAEKSV